MRQTTTRLLAAALIVFCACATRGTDDGNNDTGDNSGVDAGNPGDTGGTDGSTTDVTFTITTIGNAVADKADLHSVEIDGATVVASNSYVGTTGATIGTFYIQDDPSSPGLAVYHGASDDAQPYPQVGDVVNVQGHLSTFDGSLQISSSTKQATYLAITITGPGAGTVPPPTAGLATTDYAPTASDGHDEQVGHVIEFDDALTVTDTFGLVSTTKNTDGTLSTKPEGFTVTGGLLVDDSFVYHDCIAPLPDKANSLDLSHGIRGVWDRYQDFYAAGSSSSNPSPTQRVLFPMTCADLGLDQ